MARPKKKRMSKMEAVRQAVAQLGKKAKPGEVLDFLKTTFGIVMSAAMASNYKSSVVKEGRRKGRKPGPKPMVVSANGARVGGITLADIQAVKALTDRIGAGKVRQLAAVLSK